MKAKELKDEALMLAGFLVGFIYMLTILYFIINFIVKLAN